MRETYFGRFTSKRRYLFDGFATAISIMTRIIKSGVIAALFTTLLSLAVSAQAVKRTPFDVTNYVMDVAISPADRKLTATTDVTFTPLEDTRNIAFELNGSLKVDTITRIGGPSPVTTPATTVKGAKTATPIQTIPTAGTITFVQDQTNSSDLGPHVRIDLGEQVTKGTPITLRFKYSGVLDTAAGGPLLNKRLAFGGEQGYLMYALGIQENISRPCATMSSAVVSRSANTSIDTPASPTNGEIVCTIFRYSSFSS